MTARARPAGLAWRPLVFVGAITSAITAVCFARLPLLPAISSSLSLSPAHVGLITAVYGVGRLATDLPIGRLSDRFPARALLVVVALLAAGGSLLIAVAGLEVWVLAGALVLGVVSSAGNGIGMTYVSKSVPSQRRGTALGLLYTGLMSGQTVGPAGSGLLADRLGWRASEAVAAAVALVLSAAALGIPATGKPRARASGTAINTSSRPHGGRLGPLESAVLYLIPFAIFFAVAGLVQTLVPIVAGTDFHLSAGALGLALGLTSSLRAAVAIGGGVIADRWGRKLYLIPAMGATAAGSLLLADNRSLVVWLAGLAILQGATTAGSVGTAMLADRSTPDRLGRDLGVYRFAGDLALIAGPALVTFLYEGFGLLVSVLPAAVLLLLSAAAVALFLPGASQPEVLSPDDRQP